MPGHARLCSLSYKQIRGSRTIYAFVRGVSLCTCADSGKNILPRHALCSAVQEQVRVYNYVRSPQSRRCSNTACAAPLLPPLAK